MSIDKQFPDNSLIKSRKKEDDVEIDRLDIFNTILTFSINEKKKSI